MRHEERDLEKRCVQLARRQTAGYAGDSGGIYAAL